MSDLTEHQKALCDDLVALVKAVAEPLSAELADCKSSLRAVEAERDKLAESLAFADQQAEKLEALLEPHIKWEDCK